MIIGYFPTDRQAFSLREAREGKNFADDMGCP